MPELKETDAIAEEALPSKSVLGRSVFRQLIRHPSLVPLGAVLLAVLIGSVIMLCAGISPFVAYPAMVRGALAVENLDYTISVFTLICGMALAFALPLRMGEYNLGGNGQLVFGGITAAAIGLYAPLPAWLVIPIALLAGAVAGGLLAAVAGPLSSKLGIPIIITTLLLSTPAVALTSYLVRFQIGEAGSGQAQTARLPEAARLPGIGDLGYTNIGLILIIVLLVAFWLFDSRSALGYELRVLGSNARFGAYGGIGVSRLATGSLAVAGAVAGLVGAMIVAAPPYRFIDGALISPGYTFAGVAAALLAAGRPALLPLTAAVFTILQVGGSGMEREADVPRQLSDVLQAVVVTVLALRTVVEARRARMRRDV
ncbi:ABC transporter permease [Saxibacter everestensis]|uniref:ABC transporter permease n=1 Tax=Saxibacter everestensis TaxID=2909229 RepID=A0ABY8QS55_9MICO|nr:ABC transporter permease [Brevibacteriaceae bacterium ZFBP1038]